MFSRIILLLILGLCTGTISILPLWLVRNGDGKNLDNLLTLTWLLVGPGLLFGAALAATLRESDVLQRNRVLLWSSSAIGSHIAAVFVAVLGLMAIIMQGRPVFFTTLSSLAATAGIMGGLVGGTVLGVVTRPVLRPGSLWILALTGAAAGALLGIPITGENLTDWIGSIEYVAFYAVWQGLYAAVLAWRLRSNERPI